MTAVGLNESGAIFSGIRTRWIKIAGVHALRPAGRGGGHHDHRPGRCGVVVRPRVSDLLLPGIAAAIVGGTAITGGSTNPLNVIFGALTITLIPIGAATLGVPPQAQSLVYGLVIIIAVALTRSRASGEIVK